MSEAFVKTIKQDYVYINPLPKAKTVLKLIAEWFEDYNENHPHSGLKMRSPREFRSAQNATALVSGEIGASPVSNGDVILVVIILKQRRVVCSL
jgi:Integrase core domain